MCIIEWILHASEHRRGVEALEESRAVHLHISNVLAGVLLSASLQKRRGGKTFGGRTVLGSLGGIRLNHL